jgi:hypothetical protein
MEKIRPPISHTYTVRNGVLAEFDAVCELGIFSSLITQWEGGDVPSIKVLHEEIFGMLFRTKNVQNNEGGVSTGAAVIDYPFLVPIDVLRDNAKDLQAGRLMQVVTLR